MPLVDHDGWNDGSSTVWTNPYEQPTREERALERARRAKAHVVSATRWVANDPALRAFVEEAGAELERRMLAAFRRKEAERDRKRKVIL